MVTLYRFSAMRFSLIAKLPYHQVQQIAGSAMVFLAARVQGIFNLSERMMLLSRACAAQLDNDWVGFGDCTVLIRIRKNL